MSMGFASLCASAGYAGLRRSLRCGGANSVRLWGGGPPLF